MTELTILEQEDNEIAWSQLLVSRIVPLVLPPEDLQNPCLHVLVSEFFSGMIVHNAICSRASEAWMVWEGVTKIINALRPDFSTNNRQVPPDVTSSPINRLEQFGLLSSSQAKEGEDLQRAQRGWLHAIAQAFWATLQFTTITWLLLRSFVTALMHASSVPAREETRVGTMRMSDKVRVSAVTPGSRPNPDHEGYDKRPAIVSLKVWTCISRLTSIERRMPWFSGFVSLLQWLSLYGPGALCDSDSLLDR